MFLLLHFWHQSMACHLYIFKLKERVMYRNWWIIRISNNGFVHGANIDNDQWSHRGCQYQNMFFFARCTHVPISINKSTEINTVWVFGIVSQVKNTSCQDRKLPSVVWHVIYYTKAECDKTLSFYVVLKFIGFVRVIALYLTGVLTHAIRGKVWTSEVCTWKQITHHWALSGCFCIKGSGNVRNEWARGGKIRITVRSSGLWLLDILGNQYFDKPLSVCDDDSVYT